MKTTQSNLPLKRWRAEDVATWLSSIGMKAYVPVFRKKNITGKQLKYFTENDLITQCKITARPVRKILFKRLKHLQEKHASSAGPAGNDWSDSSEEELEGEEEVEKNEEVLEERMEPQVACEEPKVDDRLGPPLPEIEEEEKPRFTPDEASFLIQGLYRCKKAHEIVVELIREQYIKVYSLQTGRFLYKYIGNICDTDDGGEEDESRRRFSKLMKDKYVFHVKPANLYSEEDILEITFTPELATMRIQMFARYCYALKVTRALVRNTHRRIFDHINGQYFYYNPRTKRKGWCQPKLLGKERWDPMDMTLWNKDDVRLYFRRNGLSQHAIMEEIDRFDMDGPMLLSLEKNDLTRFRMPKASLRSMLNDLESMESSACNRLRSHGNKSDGNDNGDGSGNPEVIQRRERLRSHCEFIECALVIQKNVRRYLYAVKTEALHKLVQHYHELEQKRKNQALENWWSDRALNYLVLSEGEYGGDYGEDTESRRRREIPILEAR